jgi:hypothetical protein
MSAILAIALLCNHHGCLTHVLLVGAADEEQARAAAATRGWTTTYHAGHQHEHDLCPKHSKPPRTPKTKPRLRDRAHDLVRRALTLPGRPAFSSHTSSLTSLNLHVRIT